MRPTWTFERDGKRLLLEREMTDWSFVLRVTGEDGTRTIGFADRGALVSFQSNMEAFLVRTGWQFVRYAPDRRRRERRSFPRETVDRRRWWTDGLPEPVSLKHR